MVHMGFFGFLLTLLVLNVMFQEPTKTPEQLTSSFPGNEYADLQYASSEKFTNFVPEYGDPENEYPEKLTTFVPVYEYAEPQYRSDNSFGPVPNPQLLEDNAQLPAHIEYIPSDHDEINVPEEHIQLDSTGPAATEMAIHHHVSEQMIVTTEQLELDATPTVQVDTNKTETNDTTGTQTECIPSSTAITILRSLSVMLTMINTALFITTMLVMCYNDCIFFSMYKPSSENTVVVKAKYRDTVVVKANYRDTLVVKAKYRDTLTI